jgi:hypothetical protein
MSNPFLDLAERQTPSPVKARLRATETRRNKRAQWHDDEQRKLSAYYRTLRRQELDDALADDDGGKLKTLIEKLDTLTLATIPELAAFVRANGWHSAAATTLFLARRLASESIVRLREKNGLEPFDDPLPGEPEPATPEQDLRAAFADTPERSTLDHQTENCSANDT